LGDNTRKYSWSCEIFTWRNINYYNGKQVQNRIQIWSIRWPHINNQRC